MKFTLKDYQDEAVGRVLRNLRLARRRWHEDGDRQAFALSAATGAGKTVMAAAVFEALFHGDDDHDFEPDPGAVVMWFSDDPSLNEQTRFRLLEAADRLQLSDLIVVQNTFNQDTLAAGKVYFLNTQKLGRNSLLTRGHHDSGQETIPGIRPDARSFTIWDTIRNTIDDPELTLYLVLDEAHRGMGSGSALSEKQTIVKRLINGNGVMDAVPVLLGISATIERFSKAVEGMTNRSTLPDVVVDVGPVQESGLVKDTVVLDIPDEKGAFSTVLMRRGARKLVESTAAWAEYTSAEELDPVFPLMVFQVPNTPDPDDIGRALEEILKEWPEFGPGHVAHVLGDHTAKQFGSFLVPYIAPERVQDDTRIRVLIAKDAISTGWDCPRAEVMVSFRPAKDKTHITQLLGRMVRSPLARRIPGNDRLNSVECLLPFFDTKAVDAVVKALTSGESGDPDPVLTRRVLVNPIEVTPNAAVPEPVWTKFLSLPSQSVPRKTAKPVKRLTSLAHELAVDVIVPNAGKKAHAEMHAALDAAAVRYSEDVAAARAAVMVVEGKTIKAGYHDQARTFDQFEEAADIAVIEDAYRRAARLLSPDVARTYAEHLADQAEEDPSDPDAGLVQAHTAIAALGLVEEVKTYLETEADRLAARWFNEHRVAIRELSQERRDVYREIKAMSVEPQDVDITRPDSWYTPTVERKADGTEQPLPRYKRHLLSDDEGEFPAYLNGPETTVIDRELARPTSVGWYRNPSRPTQDSLAIAYKDGDRHRTVRPDFVFFTQAPDGTIHAAIVDPHGTFLGDALPKLKGLAEYAERHGAHYQRIEGVAKIGDTYRLLDITQPDVRVAIRTATDVKALYLSAVADDY